MNFGAFAGGASQGFMNGVRMGKTFQELARERGLQEIRENEMAKANTAHEAAINNLIKDKGMTGQPATDAPTSGPVDTSTPKVETPADAQAVSEASPTASPDAAMAKGAASAMAPQQVTAPAEAPTANPDAAAAATAAGNMPKGSQLPLAGQGKLTHDGLPARQNADGSYSTEVSITVTDPRLNGGKPTNIPSLWGGKEVDENTAVKNALSSGKAYQAFGSIDEAVSAAQSRSQAGGAGAAPTPQQAAAATGVNGNIPGQAGFWVNGQRYDTREQARAAAEKAVPSAHEMFMKNAVPKLAEAYIANGEPEKAKAWTDYADSVNGKRAIKDWAAAYTAPDFDTAATRFGKYYTDHINDGVDYTGHKMKVNADGTQVAVVTLKDKASGKEIEMEMTREKMLAMGSANNPQKLFEQEVAKQAQADKLKFEYQLKQQGRRADLQDKKELERYKADVNADRESNKVNSKIDAQVSSLRDAGYSDAEIKKMMPAIVGAGEHKKTTDPTERRALVASDLLKNDPTFARKSKDEQNKRIDDMMGVIYGDQAKAEPTKPAAPVIVEKPMAYDPKLPVKYRKSDGKAFHVNAKGEYVPIDGAVPTQPAEGGLPQK